MPNNVACKPQNITLQLPPLALLRSFASTGLSRLPFNASVLDDSYQLVSGAGPGLHFRGGLCRAFTNVSAEWLCMQVCQARALPCPSSCHRNQLVIGFCNFTVKMLCQPALQSRKKSIHTCIYL